MKPVFLQRFAVCGQTSNKSSIANHAKAAHPGRKSQDLSMKQLSRIRTCYENLHFDEM
jgi:hypothetical protein